MESNEFYNLFIPLKKTSEIITDAYVVIDTNVLLMAYQWRDMTFKRVYETLCDLSNQGRLKIPQQVIREFANKRPVLIQTLYKEVQDKIISSLQKLTEGHHTSLENVVPALDLMSDMKSVKDAEKNYNQAIKNFNVSKKEYLQTLKELQGVASTKREFCTLSKFQHNSHSFFYSKEITKNGSSSS